MRVIGGSCRGQTLSCFNGREIRPTADRVREALFSMLFSRLGDFRNARVLDIFAGTGALGIEALSRGAAQAWFIESRRESNTLLQQNLASCKLSDRATLLQTDYRVGLKQLAGQAFDLVFLDPPYRQGLAATTLELLGDSGLLTQTTWVCAELDSKEPLDAVYGALQKDTERRYGRTTLHLFQTDADHEREHE